MSRTPKNGSECHQIAAANQKHPATAKQPTLVHFADFQFRSSRAIPTIGRTTSKTNSKHNWKFNSGKPALRSLVNIAQATMELAAKTQTMRIILLSTLEKSAERPTSGDDRGLSLFMFT